MRPLVAEAVELGGQTRRPHRLGLADVAQTPQPGPRRLEDGGQHHLGVGGRRLRHLVQDDHRPRLQRAVGGLDGQSGDGHGRDADVAQLGDRLVGGRHPQHRQPATTWPPPPPSAPPSSCRTRPGRSATATPAPNRPAAAPRRPGRHSAPTVVDPMARSTCAGSRPLDVAVDQPVDPVQHPALQGHMGGGRPLRRCPHRLVRVGAEAHHMLGGQESARPAHGPGRR